MTPVLVLREAAGLASAEGTVTSHSYLLVQSAAAHVLCVYCTGFAMTVAHVRVAVGHACFLVLVANRHHVSKCQQTLGTLTHRLK